MITVLKKLSLLSALSGAICTLLVFVFPGSPAQPWQLTFSSGRLVLAIVLSVGWMFFLFVWIHLYFNTRLGLLVSENVEYFLKRERARDAFWLSATFLANTCVGFFILFTGASQEENYIALFSRLAPAVLWLLIVSATASMVLALGFDQEKTRTWIYTLTQVLLLGAFAAFFSLLLQLWSFTVDDAFITFRYAQNLVVGWGPTFNPTLPLVEGYTTFLWMLLMALPHLVGIDVVLASKLLGVGLTILTFGALYALVLALIPKTQVAIKHPFAALAVFFLAIFPATAIHAVAGMETACFTFLLTLLTLLVVRALGGNSNHAWLISFVALLLGLTRPEGNLLALILLVGLFVFGPRVIKTRLAGASLLFYILPGALYFFWRYLYYDLLFPLPFYLKAINPGRPLAGMDTVIDYLLHLLPPVAFFVFFAFWNPGRRTIILAFPVLALMVFYLIPVHMMGFNWRFVYPSTPLILALAGFGGMRLVDCLRYASLLGGSDWTNARLAFVVASLCLVGVSYLAGAGERISETRRIARGINSTYVQLGKTLRAFSGDELFPTMAIGDAGAVPYYSRWRVIDLIGLNDRQIAFSSVPPLDYLMSNQPDLVVIGSFKSDQFIREGTWQKSFFEGVMQAGMSPQYALKVDDTYYLWLLTYPDSPLRHFLDAKLAVWREDSVTRLSIQEVR